MREEWTEKVNCDFMVLFVVNGVCVCRCVLYVAPFDIRLNLKHRGQGTWCYRRGYLQFLPQPASLSARFISVGVAVRWWLGLLKQRAGSATTYLHLFIYSYKNYRICMVSVTFFHLSGFIIYISFSVFLPCFFFHLRASRFMSDTVTYAMNAFDIIFIALWVFCAYWLNLNVLPATHTPELYYFELILWFLHKQNTKICNKIFNSVCKTRNRRSINLYTQIVVE